MNVFKKLFGSKPVSDLSSTDLKAALEKLCADVVANETRLGELNASMRTALFDSEADVGALRKQIRTVEDELETLQEWIVEAQTRATEAEAREFAASIETRMVEARQDWDALRTLCLEIDEHAWQLAQTIERYRVVERRFQDANRLAANNGRSDLKITHPMVLLQEHLDMRPGAIEIPDRIAGYFPMHPRGRMLQRMKELKL